MPARTALTIIDIARLSGVSKSTVSRVLSGSEKVSPEARKKVDEIVSASGYRRNDLARSLRSGRTGMVGLLIPDIANPFWAEVARGAQDAAAEDGVSVLIFNSDWDPEREKRHLRALTQTRVDGVIVNPVRDGLQEIAAFDMPVVLIGSSATRYPHISSVGSDIEQGVALGLNRIAVSGLGQPVLLVGDAERTARERFLTAVRDNMRRLGWSHADLIIEDGHYTVEGGRAALERILDRQLPRAVFAANDLMALGALQAARHRGLRCPQDVAILGFDGILAGEVSAPALTTIEKPARELGRRAFAVLTDQLRGDAEVLRLSLPCKLNERESLPPLPPD
jgi:LacI family transcriptional regulator